MSRSRKRRKPKKQQRIYCTCFLCDPFRIYERIRLVKWKESIDEQEIRETTQGKDQ